MSATHSKPFPLRRPHRTIRFAAALLAVVAIGIAGYFWLDHRAVAGSRDGDYRTATAERGDILVMISATGSLAAISTVDVGSQISGQVIEVLADFNDRVERDQVLARIDPATYEAQIAQGSAAAASARASLASAQATLRNAQADYARKAELAQWQLVAASDADLARAARDQARAQVNAAQAQITQQIASTRTSQLNLQRTVIRSPVDGVVLTRTVEPGMTVAASLQSPVLFQIAEDLAQMEIVLAIDEADIGQVQAGQGVNFSVDAFPERQFRGTVQQVRLSATNTNNVITYPVVVAVDNADQVLLPGMTANAEIEVSRRDDVLRVPNATLRYKPADEDSAIAPAAAAARGGSGVAADLPRLAAALQLDDAQQAAFDAALASLRERAAMRIQAPAAGTNGNPPMFGDGPSGRASANASAGNDSAMRQRLQERFDQQFAAFRATLDEQQQVRWDSETAALVNARRAPLYRLADGRAQTLTVRLGASDGSWTEVSGDIAEGDVLIVGSSRPAQ